MPSEIDATDATEKPTSPTRNAQAPKAARTGSPFGIRLKSPSPKLRSASISTSEIKRIAMIVPLIMLSTLRSVT